MSSKGRVGIAAAVLAVVVVAMWHWCQDDESLTPSETTATQTARVMPARDPITKMPRWLVAGAEGRRIAGTVIGEDGAPVRGASVTFASTLTMAGVARAGKRVTDEAGRFDFGAQPAVKYLVVAESPRLTGAAQQIDLRDSAVASDQLTLVLHSCQASIFGTIRENAGGVLPHAVVARAANGVSAGGVEADDRAGYELCVPPGGTEVTVMADGYVAVRDQVSIFGRVRRDFTLRPATSVMGRVVRAGDRTPVAGAIVEVVAADPQMFAKLTGSSDGDGRFHIEGLPPGRHLVRARADHLATLEPADVVAEIGITNEVVCEVVPAFTISGQVIAKDSRTPLPDIAVVMSEPRGFQEVLSGSDGTFVFDHVHPGDYQIYVRHDMRFVQSTKVEAADTRVTFELDRPGTISGRVMRAGKPAPDAIVQARPLEADGFGAMSGSRSDHEGRFTLRGIAAGTYRLYSESHWLGAFTPGPTVKVATGEHRSDVVIDLDLSASVAGIVVDQNAAPVAGAFVRFSLLGGRDFGQATTAEDGRFTARGMSGGGNYLYEVMPHGSSAVGFPPKVGKRFPPVAVRDGNTHVEGLRIEVRFERFAIAGRVVDANGGPAVDVTVRVTSPNHEESEATTDAGGAFRIRDLAAGTYAIRAVAPHGEVRADGVSGGRTDVVLRLPANGTIEGTLEGFDSVPAVQAFRLDYFRQHRAVVNANKFTIRDVPPGEYQIIVPDDGSRGRVVVPAGGIAKVTLRKEAYGSILVTVIDDKRTRLSGVVCGSTSGATRAPPTNANGEVRLERLSAGSHRIVCFGTAVEAFGEATVTAGQTTQIELVATSERPRAYAGLTFEMQLSELRVAAVVPDGPAARAGVVAGDFVIEIDGAPVKRWQGYGMDHLIEGRSLDRPLKLTLERDDKRLTVSITLVPHP